MGRKTASENECMSGFSPLIRDWFLESIGSPSEPQRRGWPEIASGRNVLICSPTGSGKTFAAFLKCLDWVISEKSASLNNIAGYEKYQVKTNKDDLNKGIRIIYISPLKALNNDIYRNLELPLDGLRQKAHEQGMEMPELKIAVRTGDTPQKDRAKMLKDPPDILITTPESLFIMLTSDSYRKLFRTVEYIIVDEIHYICSGKRGVHLSLSIERVERIAGKPLKRIGLTATINPSYQAKQYDIESVRVPQNCLDVLVQQIVSIACEGEQDTDEIFAMVRKAYPYRNLPKKQFDDVILMLSDPSPEDAPGSLKPRIFYDRDSGMVRATPVGRRMCLMNSGTIPDKGNFNVYISETNVKVGELQEEFVFESRIGDRFFLGSTVWRIEKIEKDRVLVSPSNASGARIPFWIGDKALRDYETGKKLGRFLQKLEKEYSSEWFCSFMSEKCGLDRTAAENLRTFIEDQLAATGHLPSDGRIICEHFSDETGDRRIVIHTPFGGRIHAPLAIILHSKLSGFLNCRIEYIYNNDGILFHIFGYTGKLSNIFSLLDKNAMEDEIFELLPGDYIFNTNLRYNLIRSFLVDMNGFGKRNPLWIQRLRCAETSEQILKEPDHPAVVETFRECMNDVFDIGSLYDLIDRISTGIVKVTDVYTEKPSPFTAELLFNFWQIYQYSYELPVAERRNQLLVKDRDFIQLAAGLNAEYELLDPRAIKAVEKEFEKYRYNRKINNADDLWYFLYSFGELKAEPYFVSVFKGTSAEDVDTYIEQLEKQRRIIRVNISPGNSLYWIAAEDFPLYCITSGGDPENETVVVGKPGEEKEDKAVNLLSSYVFDFAPGIRDAAVRLIRRHIMFSGPFGISDVSKKYGMKEETVIDALQVLVSAGEALKIKESDDPYECIYCHRKVYEKIKQRTVQLARKDIKPKEPEVYCTYLLNRHLVTDKVLSSEEKLIEVLKILNGQYYPASWWEDFILPSRINGYSPRMLDYLCVTGQVRWKGRLSKNIKETTFIMTGEEDARQEYVTDQGGSGQVWSHDTEPDENPADFTMDETEAKILEVLDEEGAVFLKDMSKIMKLPPSDLLAKMERLVWCGIITNDSYSVARYYIDNERKNSPWTTLDR